MSEQTLNPLQAEIIGSMTWSYSRVKQFYDCPYAWYLKYLYRAEPDNNMFFASYGTLVHELIRDFYNGAVAKDSLVSEYVSRFSERIKPLALPNENIFKKYFSDGLRYFLSFTPLSAEKIEVERKIRTKISGYDFVGYIDALIFSNGKITINDYKSRQLSREKRGKNTKKDDELNSYFRQLYLYSVPIEEENQRPPDKLTLTCFRNNAVITEKFSKSSQLEAVEWFAVGIERIKNEREFKPYIDFFKCTYICPMHNECDYYTEMFGGK